MKKIVAINASPRPHWNTGTLVRDAAEGSREAGAEVQVIDLYALPRFTGCISCFGCKLPQNLGRCVCRDGLTPVLDAIREADGLILGSPNYLGDLSAGFRALYERLVFQSLTYKTEVRSYNSRPIPVLLITTSNVAEDFYDRIVYTAMLDRYRRTLEGQVGPTELLIAGDTLQVADYGPYDWTIFDPAAKQARREQVFPTQRQQARAMGADLVK